MPTWLSNLIPGLNWWKLAFVGLLAGSLFLGGYLLGSRHEIVKTEQQVVTKVLTQTKYLPAEQAKEATQVTKVKTVHDKIYLEVPTVVAVNPVCDLGPGPIGLLNTLRGTLSPQP